MTIDLSRRNLLRTSMVAGLGVPLVSACSNEGRGGGTSPGAPQQVDSSLLPNYIPYEDVEPDLIGSDGVANAFFEYPAEPVKAHSEAPGDGQPIRTMGITNTPIPPGVDNNEFWQGLNERLGSELSINLSTPADYEQKFPTAVAGGQLPDVWGVGVAPQLPQLLESQALDLSQYLSGDAVEAYPFLANIPTDSWRSTVYNGKIFGVPVPRGVISTYILYGRDDLLAAKGITEGPASFEDFVDICTELTEPQNNKWALSYIPTDYIRQMFGVPNGWSQDDDGTLVHAYEHEGQKEALEAARGIVEAGLMNPDAFSAQWQDYKVWFANGTTHFNYDSFSAWSNYFQLYAGSGDFSLTAMPPPQADGGGQASAWLGNPTNSITAINKNAEDRVETLLKFLNYLASPFGTEEYKYIKYGNEGVHHTLEGSDPILTTKGQSEVQMGLLYMTDAPWPIYQPGMPDGTQAQYDAQMSIVPNAIRNPAMGLYSETSARQGSQLSSTMGNLQNDILQGREPVSAWDDAVASWKSGGGDKIRDEYMAALEETE